STTPSGGKVTKVFTMRAMKSVRAVGASRFLTWMAWPVRGSTSVNTMPDMAQEVSQTTASSSANRIAGSGSLLPTTSMAFSMRFRMPGLPAGACVCSAITYPCVQKFSRLETFQDEFRARLVVPLQAVAQQLAVLAQADGPDIGLGAGHQPGGVVVGEEGLGACRAALLRHAAIHGHPVGRAVRMAVVVAQLQPGGRAGEDPCARAVFADLHRHADRIGRTNDFG